MKLPTLKVYSEYVQLVGGTAQTVYSGIQHMAPLAAMQPLAMQVVLDWAGGTELSVEAHIEHAGDGFHYVQKNPTSEIPTQVFNATGGGTTTSAALAGAEVFTVAPSHDDVRIATTLASSVASIVYVEVYATGQNRVKRAHQVRKDGDEVLPESLRDRLPPSVAAQVEAFRRRAGMSSETLNELEHLWDKADTEDSPRSRAQSVDSFLSGRARREVERFQTELRRLSPQVLNQLKIGIAKQAHAELARPAWGEDNEMDDGDEA